MGEEMVGFAACRSYLPIVGCVEYGGRRLRMCAYGGVRGKLNYDILIYYLIAKHLYI